MKISENGLINLRLKKYNKLIESMNTNFESEL